MTLNTKRVSLVHTGTNNVILLQPSNRICGHMSLCNIMSHMYTLHQLKYTQAATQQRWKEVIKYGIIGKKKHLRKRTGKGHISD